MKPNFKNGFNFTLLSLALVLSFGACTKKNDNHDPVERVNDTTIKIYSEGLKNIQRSKAAISDFPELLYLMGKVGVTEDRTTIVPARVSGRTETINFSSGEFVKQGQVLMTLFSPDFVAAKEEYLQALKQSQTPTGTADPSDFANLAQMSRKRLETMGLTAEDIQGLSETNAKESMLTIHSPRNGVIMAKNAALGNLVNVGDTLFTIGDLSHVWFTGDLYPEDLPKIKKNQKVVINVEGLNKPVFGKVSFISPLVDPTTRSIKIRALMDNPNGYLRQDMYVQGSVTLTEKKSLLVPATAVVRDPEGDVVYKRLDPQTMENTPASLQFQKVPVKVSAIQGGMAAISEGLQEGDEVVSQGALLLDGVLNEAEDSK